MDVVLMDASVAHPSLLVIRGLTGLAHLRSLCTWGALLLAAAAAFGSLVRALRKKARWILLHRARVVVGSSGDGAGMAASVVPDEPSVDFSDDDESLSQLSGCSPSTPCSGSDDCFSREGEGEGEVVDEDEDGVRGWGWCFHDEPEKRKRRSYEQQRNQDWDWGFGPGGWESLFGGGNSRVVRDWEQDSQSRSYSNSTLFSLGSPSSPLSSGFVPLLKSAFCLPLEPPSLTLGWSDGGPDLRLWDSRIRSSVPAAAVVAPPKGGGGGLRKRLAVGVGKGNRKVVYVAEQGGGGAVVDLRNTMKPVMRTDDNDNDNAEDTWWDADAVFRQATTDRDEWRR